MRWSLQVFQANSSTAPLCLLIVHFRGDTVRCRPYGHQAPHKFIPCGSSTAAGARRIGNVTCSISGHPGGARWLSSWVK